MWCNSSLESTYRKRLIHSWDIYQWRWNLWRSQSKVYASIAIHLSFMWRIVLA